VVKVKVSGPLLSSTIPETTGSDLDTLHRIDASLRDGDLTVHVHLSWKAFVAFGLIVVQTLYTLLVDQLHIWS
jgi:hypothetical protein